MARLSTYGISRSSARRRWIVIAFWIVTLLIAGYHGNVSWTMP